MRLQLILTFVLLSSCAITDEERLDRLMHLNEIETAFEIFERDCNIIDGYLYVPQGRISNAPPTVWEKTRAQCWYTTNYGLRRIERIEI